MSHVLHMNESCHTRMGHVSYISPAAAAVAVVGHRQFARELHEHAANLVPLMNGSCDA